MFSFFVKSIINHDEGLIILNFSDSCRFAFYMILNTQIVQLKCFQRLCLVNAVNGWILFFREKKLTAALF